MAGGPQRHNLHAVEEGDPGHRGRKKLAARVKAPPTMPVEPDWSQIFPGDDVHTGRLRATARAEWAGVVEPLHRLGVLSGALDTRALMDYCICCARIDECERDISERGLTVLGKMHEEIRNPSTVTVTAYRQQLRSMLTHLGLSPNARAGLKQPSVTDDGGQSPWSR